MSPRPRVVVTRKLPTAVEEKLTSLFDARLDDDDQPLDAEQMRQAVRDADALLPTVTDRLDAGVLETGSRLRIVANFGAGTDHIDLDSARRRGITVTNTPDVLTGDTADIALMLMLMAARRAGEGERELRAGAWTGWRPTHLLGTRVHGATLGIVGLGRIGQAVAKRARDGFGMRVLFHDRSTDAAWALRNVGAERCERLEELLERSDFISLHTPATPETKHLIDAERLRLMRRSSVLVNTARGSVVDEAALAEALRTGVIAAAGLDVYEREPLVHPDLLHLDNVVLLPHLGSATTAGREAMGWKAIRNLERFFAGEELEDRVV